MLTELIASLRAIVALTALTCVLYPLAVTGIVQAAFPTAANGSLLKKGGQIIGSSLLAQKFTSPRYFWPRPSAVDYATVASGASNQGFTSRKLVDAIAERRTTFGGTTPADMLTASGSGLDPDISIESAQAQIGRIAQVRSLPSETIANLIATQTQQPQLGFLGQPRINVLALNLALDAAK